MYEPPSVTTKDLSTCYLCGEHALPHGPYSHPEDVPICERCATGALRQSVQRRILLRREIVSWVWVVAIACASAVALLAMFEIF